MSDPIDDLEAMIADALSAAEAMGMLPEIQATIKQWRERYGGDSLYICRRAHIQRHARIMELIEAGLSPSEVANRLGVTRQTVHNAKKSSAIL